MNHGAGPTVMYRDPDDRKVTIERAALRQQILAALTPGPLMKWQLREALHIPEHVILGELKYLHAAGVVKNVGIRLAERRWALASYQPAPIPTTAVIANAATV